MNDKTSYFKNYLSIYVWQFISIVFSFCSYYFVIPYLSSNKELYGIYSICSSILLFYSYADIGFLSASQKYAAEYYAKGDKVNEMHQIGFGAFILFLVVGFISIGVFCISFNPEWLIKNLYYKSESYNIARKLLLILSVSSFLGAFRRVIQIVFDIRLESYLYQKVVILSNIFKLFSIFCFFSNNNYDIVGYFLFTQLVDALITITGLLMIKRRYDYDIVIFLKSIKYSNIIFRKVKKLALSGMLLTISWIIYYELDSVIIGRLLGAEAVAIYAIAFSMLSFFRAILGVVYSPYQTRLNYFKATDDFENMKNFSRNIIVFSFPLVVFPILIIYVNMGPIVMSWVGDGYFSSIAVAKLLVLCNLFAFISYPGGQLLSTNEKTVEMSRIAWVIPLVYWIGIGMTYRYYGLESFGYFKLLAFIVSIIFYSRYLSNFFSLSIIELFAKILQPYYKIIIIQFPLLLACRPLFQVEHSKTSLFTNVLLLISLFLISTVLLLLFDTPYKTEIGKRLKR